MDKIFKNIIQEISLEEEINCTCLSKDWIIMLEKCRKTRFIIGYKFDLNPQGVAAIVDDKYALYEVLKNKNIPIVEYKIVYPKTNKQEYAIGCNTYEYVEEFFKQNNEHIVIKPNSGTCGRNVYQITNQNQIEKILDKLFINNHAVSISPFYNIKHEYRVIMLKGECKLIYAKYLPIVVGDGKRTIRQLLLEFNKEYFSKKLENNKYNKILEEQEEFEYNWKFNLSQGAIAKEIEDEILKNKLLEMAKKVCKEINLNFGSVDIIQTDKDELMVLEVNSGVMIENYIKQNIKGYDIAKDIYKEAVKLLFENN